MSTNVKALRAAYMGWIREDGYNIYSTATLKDGSHRLSIPWFVERYVTPTRLKELKDRLRHQRGEFLRQLEAAFPQLRGRLTWKLHAGACVYLSLRIAPEQAEIA